MAQVFNPRIHFNFSTWEAEANGFFELDPCLVERAILRWPGLHFETLSQKPETKKNKTKQKVAETDRSTPQGNITAASWESPS